SMMRYIRLWPPPRHHDVRCPWLLRPPVLRSGSTSGLYGSWVVMSSKVCTVWNRVPGDVGLSLRNGIKRCTVQLSSLTAQVSASADPCALRVERCLCALQEFRHLLAFAQHHVGLLPVRPAAGEPALALD